MQSRRSLGGGGSRQGRCRSNDLGAGQAVARSHASNGGQGGETLSPPAQPRHLPTAPSLPPRLDCLSRPPLLPPGLKPWDALTAPQPLDPWLDLLATAALRTVLHAKLEAYPTPLETDEAEIATSPPAAGASNETAPPPPAAAAARRRWLALVLRASEKRILRAAVARMDSMMQTRCGGAHSHPTTYEK
eukprot:scaffold2058_cov115-Isochrysis_galbana.AAC.3